jgi:putative protease
MNYLEPLKSAFEYLRAEKLIVPHEISFEPKRAFLGKVSPEDLFNDLLNWAREAQVTLRVALPTVIRAWDEPLLKRWLKVAYDLGVRRFEVGNIGALVFLEELAFEDIHLASDFTLYALNQFAAKELQSLSVSRYALSLENDKRSLESQLRTSHFPGFEPELILYKDTPLFIAESCSLTALHGGCPTAKVCGYRTLDIVNDEGEEFQVIHESCKSIVIGKNAFSISEERPWAAQSGIKYVRADFLSRSYSHEDIFAILKTLGSSKPIFGTHTGNHFRTLL